MRKALWRAAAGRRFFWRLGPGILLPTDKGQDAAAALAEALAAVDAPRAASTSIDGAAPAFCTDKAAAALAISTASRRSMLLARHAARAPQKQSPAPTVSTRLDLPALDQERLVAAHGGDAGRAQGDDDRLVRAAHQLAGRDRHLFQALGLMVQLGVVGQFGLVEDQDVGQGNSAAPWGRGGAAFRMRRAPLAAPVRNRASMAGGRGLQLAEQHALALQRPWRRPAAPSGWRWRRW
jgi:hypothetical protein